MRSAGARNLPPDDGARYHGSMTTRAKICGLSTPDAVAAAIDGGAAQLGFVFFPKSPRNVPVDLAAALAAPARGRAEVVAVVVDPSDAQVDEIASRLRPDAFQLHGGETLARAADLARRTGARMIKALPVATAEDLHGAEAWDAAGHQLMFDAKPPAGSTLPGGVGARFDWDLMAGRRFSRPWFLAGGLTAHTVVEAIRRSGAPLVDVSSGVETAPGLKDARLISAFLAAVSHA